tara:strand:- start:68 stop:901 length:834 start_codon:yes stop_codon:yes gene_type:complete
MNYTITTPWFGRTGNNIQSISNAIYFCRLKGINFHSPPNGFIEEFSENFGAESNLSSPFFTIKDFNCDKPCYIKDDIMFCDINDLYSQRKDICETFILPRLKIPLLKDPLPSSTLVVHIRGGDIFDFNPAYVGFKGEIDNFPGMMVQNPLCFYENLFKKFKSVLIVAEDFSNPVIKHLQKNEKVKVVSSSIEEDFSLLLRAKNLATSGVGTFAIAAALCSKNIENLFCTNLFYTHHLNPTMLEGKINVEINNLEGYIKKGEWKNTCSQRKLMVTYKC